MPVTKRFLTSNLCMIEQKGSTGTCPQEAHVLKEQKWLMLGMLRRTEVTLAIPVASSLPTLPLCIRIYRQRSSFGFLKVFVDLALLHTLGYSFRSYILQETIPVHLVK